MDKIISATRARKDFFRLIEEADQPGNSITITVDGDPKVVMMSSEEFENWQETLETLKDFPNLKDDVAEVEKDIESGAYKSYVTLDRLLAREGYILADKSKKKYEISPRLKTKRRKGASRSQ